MSTAVHTRASARTMLGASAMRRASVRRALSALVFFVLATGCMIANRYDDVEDVEMDESEATTGDARARSFVLGRKGAHLEREAGPELACSVRVRARGFDFPAGARDLAVSPTAKSMCFTRGPYLFCHVSGTGTGLCEDTLDNARDFLLLPQTIDGAFVDDYIARHPNARAIVSGHSQGAYDASRVTPRLRRGDELVLLQPIAAAVVPNAALVDAMARGVRVFVAWSANDNASLGIRLLAGTLPLIELPAQWGTRVHSAPNARDQIHRVLGVASGRTINLALDASILSNPDSPRGEWTFPAWSE